MKRARPLLVLGAVALAWALPQGAGAAANGTFVCNISPDSSTGVAGNFKDVVVPPNGFCLLNGANVSHDVTAEQNSTLAVANTTIGHDLTGHAPQALSTGVFAGPPGPVSIGHDLTISGADPNGIAYDICDTSVGHDLAITGTQTFDEIEVGDIAPDEFCAAGPNPPVSVGHDLVVSHNTAARVDVGDNHIAHDLTVQGNTATGGDGSTPTVDVSDNHVGHDANCGANNPPQSPDGPEDGPNQAGHRNNCTGTTFIGGGGNS